MGRLAALALAIMLIGATPATAAGPTTRGYVLDNTANSLAVLDPATNTVTNRVALPFDSSAFTVRPDGREIYVFDLALEGHLVAVVSTTTHTVVATIPVGTFLRALAFTPDSRRAYLSTGNSVQVIDTATRRVVKTIAVNGSGLAVAPDGTKVYLASASGVVVISTATNTIIKTIGLGRAVGSVVFSPNGRLALVNSGHLIDVRTDTVTSPILPLARSQQRFLFTPDSAGVYIANTCGDPPRVGNLNRVQLASPSVVTTIFSGGNPNGLALSPDGTRLYVQLFGAGGVSMLDTATDRVLDTFGVTETVPQLNGIALSDTAPPAANPGQRLAPRPLSSNLCLI